jgi:hypothetical protein
MHFKNHKSSELYILPNLVHIISMLATSLQFIMHRGIGITRPFSISLTLARFDRCPTTARAPTPPPSPPQRTHARTPLPTVAARMPSRQRVPPPTFPSIFLLHAWPQHIHIYTTNEARQKHPPRQHPLLPFTTQISKAHRQHARITSMQSTSKQVLAVHPHIHTYR